MKKIILILLLFLLNVALIKASITVEHECEDYRCTEGTDIIYSVNIKNNIDKEIVVNYIKIKNEYDQNIAIFDESNCKLMLDESNTFNITEKVPLPQTGYSLDYYACFGVTIKYLDGQTEVNEVCGETRKSLTVLPSSKIQCKQNSECKFTEYCDIDFFKCRDLNCKGNLVFNHKCYNYFAILIPLIIISIALVFFNSMRKFK